MGVNFQKIKKWTNMIIGKSPYHVNQDEGKIYSKTLLKGYYNNLTEKVTRFGLSGNTIPTTIVDSGNEIYFPIAIFQYGLAAYDLYLLKHGDVNDLKSKVIACANWAIQNQRVDGSWETFTYETPNYPFSSMAQGEAISLLLRAYTISGEMKYVECAKKSYEFMILPISNGGTAKYDGESIYFYECTADPLILNGWIFSIWGIMDYWIFFKEDKVKNILDKSIKTLEQKLPDFDIGYWSKYEDGMRISSPFYHSLHIAQLKVLYDLTGIELFKTYSDKWNRYKNNSFNRIRAFLIKAIQKIFKE